MNNDMFGRKWSEKWCTKGKHFVDTEGDDRKWAHKWCPDCTNDYNKELYYRELETSREKARNYRRSYREKHKDNPDYRDKVHSNHLKGRYGITLEDKKAMLIQQEGLCAICKKELGGNFTKIHTDHNHETGKVRGLLCRYCNYGMGFKDNELWDRLATIYKREYDG